MHWLQNHHRIRVPLWTTFLTRGRRLKSPSPEEMVVVKAFSGTVAAPHSSQVRIGQSVPPTLHTNGKDTWTVSVNSGWQRHLSHLIWATAGIKQDNYFSKFFFCFWGPGSYTVFYFQLGSLVSAFSAGFKFFCQIKAFILLCREHIIGNTISDSLEYVRQFLKITVAKVNEF